MKKNRAFRILVFFIIAVTFSNLFRFETFGFGKILNDYPLLVKIASVPLQSISVLFGGLLGLYWLSQQQEIRNTLFGASRKWTVIMAALPVVLLSLLGIENSQGINTHLFGFIIAIILLIYCVFEEYGWRGYLEEELKDSKEWVRVLIIATLWYSWHLPFIDNHDILSNLKFFGFMVLGSWGIGKVIHLTHSVLVAACFHMLYSILILHIENEVFLETSKKLIIIGICIVSWVVIINILKKKNAISNFKN